MILKKYDLLMIKKTSSIYGKIVKIALKSQYSHVAIYVGNYHVIDVDFLNPVSIHEINNSLGDFDVYRYKGIFKIEQEQIIDEFLMKSINTKYDSLEAFGTWLKMNFGNNKKYICISLATEAFKKAGICLENDESGFNKIIKCKDLKRINNVK